MLFSPSNRHGYLQGAVMADMANNGPFSQSCYYAPVYEAIMAS